MILLIVLLIIALIIFSIVIGVFLMENDGIVNDQLITEYLDNIGSNFSIYHSEYNHSLNPNYPAKVRRTIYKSPQVIRLVFPYYIEYVGAIPTWSKSKPRLDAMFGTGVKTDWRREKLGL